MVNLIGQKKHFEKESKEQEINSKEQKEEINAEKEENKEEKRKNTEELAKDKKEEKIEELTDLVKRIQAEFENFKKREENQRKIFVEFSNAELIRNLLPVLDSIDSAKHPLNLLEKDSSKQNVERKTEEIKGIELIEKQLVGVLEKYGLREIQVLGKKFNPEFHECILKENNPEKEDGIILEELQKGFMIKDKVLRHSKVKINSIEEKAEENE